MKGSIKWQVDQIFYKSGINKIGESKHSAKEHIKSGLESKNQKATWHVMGKNLGIYSYRTADIYRDVWRQIGKYVKENYKIRDLRNINGDHIKSYLQSKVENRVAHNTFAQYSSAIEKFETALNGFSEKNGDGFKYDFSNSIKEIRNEAHHQLERFNGSREYENPKALIENIKNEEHKLVAKIQLESGCRVSECTYLSMKNMKGIGHDPVTKEEKGIIFITQSKGGKSGEKYVSPETYKELFIKIQTSVDGRFNINNGSYRDSLKKASELSNQNYTGSHGLRWNFAQDRFNEVQNDGVLNNQEALYQVSSELFHERADITKHYLKK